MLRLSTVRSLLTGLVLVVGIGAWCQAADIFVAPDGQATGDGSIGNPIDLATAISAKGPAKPGDTIILKGGQYDGAMTKEIERVPFRPTLSGTAEAPIRITSAPGEWAHLNGAIDIRGANHVHFVRLEVGDLKWDLFQETHKVQTAFNVVQGEGIKIINCNIFGGAMGTGLWTPAVNLEAYGNIVHDFGTKSRAGGRGHGHAFYMQNDQGTKTIRHNIAYRSAGWLYNIYTQGGKINGFDVIENIGFMGGYYAPGQTSFSFGLTGWQPSERIRFIGNVAYQPRDSEPHRANMRLMTHYKTDVIHRDAVVTDNYIMGAHRGLAIGMWKDIQITGNTFWATKFMNEISSGPSGSGIAEHPEMPNLSNYRVDHNTYYDTGHATPFIYGRHEKTKPEELLTFTQWQALGLDTNSRVLPTRDGKPTGVKVFVFPNEYEAGRGNIAVFNWDGQDQVEVDLTAVLKPGQAFRVYNCLDIKQTISQATPVLTGEYAGGKVSLPTRKAEDSPDFDAFLVLPE